MKKYEDAKSFCLDVVSFLKDRGLASAEIYFCYSDIIIAFQRRGAFTQADTEDFHEILNELFNELIIETETDLK